MSYNTLYEDGTKLCSVCKEIKPISDFYSNKARSTGSYSSCKICFKPTLKYPKVNEFNICFEDVELLNENWTPIQIGGVEYPYKISDLGRIFSINTNKVCKYSFDQRGYPQVIIYGDKRISRRVHRLVALAYVPNPLRKREVNHKDGDKLNTRASNMEWVTSRENTDHAYKTGLRCN